MVEEALRAGLCDRKDAGGREVRDGQLRQRRERLARQPECWSEALQVLLLGSLQHKESKSVPTICLHANN